LVETDKLAAARFADGPKHANADWRLGDTTPFTVDHSAQRLHE
jgi:hypothetical protein